MKKEKEREKITDFSYSAMDEYFKNCKKNAQEYIKKIERVVSKKDVNYILEEKINIEPTENSEKQKRSSERIFLRIPVYVYTENTIYMDYSVDISEGGIGLESLEPLEKGKRVNLTLYFSHDTQLNTSAEVAWSTRENTNKTVGFCFKDLTPEVKNNLLQLIFTSKNKQPSDG